MTPTAPNPFILHQPAPRSFPLTPFPNRSTLAPTRVRAWSLRERGGLPCVLKGAALGRVAMRAKLVTFGKAKVS
jgi:hypothetical protein